MSSPEHVAIIMDGNGRWGLKKKNSRNYGHKKGLETIDQIISFCIKKKNKIFNIICIFNRKLEETIKRNQLFILFT